MTRENQKDSITMWQDCYLNDGIAEPSLLISPYFGNIVGVMQNGKELLINTSSLNEFIKTLKKVAKLAEALD